MNRPEDADVAAPPVPPAPEPVAAEVRCIRCRYQLAGLSPDGDCPECGTEIARSLSEDRLADADPRWLGRILLGLALLGWGPWAILISILLGLFIGVVIGAFAANDLGLPRAIEVTFGVVLFGVGLGVMGGVVVAAIGGVLVTSIEPRDEGEERLDEPRLIARWGLVVAVILPAAHASIEEAVAWPMPESVRFAVLAAAMASGGFALVALHARFRDFAVRIPSSSLAARADRGRAWYRGVTIYVVALMVLHAGRDLSESVPALSVLSDVLAVVSVLGSCVAFVVLVIAFFRSFGILDLALSLRSTIRTSLASGAVASAAPVPAEADGR